MKKLESLELYKGEKRNKRTSRDARLRDDRAGSLSRVHVNHESRSTFPYKATPELNGERPYRRLT